MWPGECAYGPRPITQYPLAYQSSPPCSRISTFINAGPRQTLVSPHVSTHLAYFECCSFPFLPQTLYNPIFFSPSGILNGATQHSVFLEGRKWCWCCCGEGLQRGWDISQAEGRTWSMAGICRLITPLGDFRSNFRGAESGILWSTTISQSLFFHMFFPLHRS